jgi:pimeloyl-ACP methyl ester carboxylesterase
MAERLGVPFTAIPKAGHSVNVEQPERLVEVLLGYWASAPVHQADAAEPAG